MARRTAEKRADLDENWGELGGLFII